VSPAGRSCRTLASASERQAQETDTEIKKYLLPSSCLQMKQTPLQDSPLMLWCDYTTPEPRPFLPVAFRRAAFQQLHDLTHPGVKSSVRLVSARYVWPKLQTDCANWARACDACQRAKVHRHVSAPLQQFPTTTERFSVVHIDLIGPLPPSEEFRYCLTMIDRYTRWPEVVPLKSMTADDVIRALRDGWLGRFGVPTTVVCDQGRQFTSGAFKEFATNAGFQVHHTNAYHPQANGMIERLHRTLKAALMCHKSSWSVALSSVLLGLRSVLKEDIGSSPAQLVYGEAVRLPGDFFVPPPKSLQPADLLVKLHSHMAEMCPTPAAHHSGKSFYVHPELAKATHVFLRTDALRPALTPPYSGPYKVLQRDDKTYVLEVKGRSKSVSIDRLKPAFSLSQQPPLPVQKLVTVYVPARCQRPAIAPQPVNEGGALPPAVDPDEPPAPVAPPPAPPLPPAPPAPPLPPAPTPLRQTRYGRTVHFPKHFDDFQTSSLKGGTPVAVSVRCRQQAEAAERWRAQARERRRKRIRAQASK
jgi:hypothetical protein